MSSGNKQREINGVDGTSATEELKDSDLPGPLDKFSPKAVQSLYNEITGKTEEMRRTYAKNFKVDFEDIKSLYTKLEQASEQYEVVAKNYIVTVWHSDDTRDDFSSFERFEFHSNSMTSSTDAFRIRCNYLVRQPCSGKTQSYQIDVKLTSSVSAFKKLSKDVPFGFLRLIQKAKASLSIQYVDYMVARNFKGVVDDWFDLLDENKVSALYKILFRSSRFAPGIFEFLSVLVYSYFAIFTAKNYIQNMSIDHLFYSIVCSCVAILFFYKLSGSVGELLESSIGSYAHVSFVRLSKFDEREICDAQQTNKSNILKAIVSVLIAIVINVLSSYVAVDLLKISQ